MMNWCFSIRKKIIFKYL